MAEMICRSCGSSLPEGAKFCPSCLTRVEALTPPEPIRCRQCGKELQVGWRGCPDCGTPVNGGTSQGGGEVRRAAPPRAPARSLGEVWAGFWRDLVARLRPRLSDHGIGYVRLTLTAVVVVLFAAVGYLAFWFLPLALTGVGLKGEAFGITLGFFTAGVVLLSLREQFGGSHDTLAMITVGVVLVVDTVANVFLLRTNWFAQFGLAAALCMAAKAWEFLYSWGGVRWGRLETFLRGPTVLQPRDAAVVQEPVVMASNSNPPPEGGGPDAQRW